MDADVLHSCALDMQALKRAKDLRAVIAQAEAGDVQRMRQLYGPEKGRPTCPMWKQIKGTVTRRERVYDQLVKEFQGNKELFFSFFSIPGTPDMLRPYRKIAEAIPWMQDDLAAERALPCYRNEAGSFSSDCWEQRWGGKNSWETWRALGKEQYSLQ